MAGWTKMQFVAMSYAKIGYASYIYDAQPEQLQTALFELDAMMAAWNKKGIRLGYPLPSSPQDSNLDQVTNVPDSANEAIYTNLAIRLAPNVGKSASQEIKQIARESYLTLAYEAAKPQEMQFPSTMPVGAGNKSGARNSRPFFPSPVDPLSSGQDGEIEFN